MVRARGSYPRSPGFKSPRRHHICMFEGRTDARRDTVRPSFPRGRDVRGQREVEVHTLLLEKVQRVIEQNGLLERGDLVVVGVSGGPDSVALLHILWRLSEGYALKVHVAHLNHRMRAEAEQDARFVEELAAQFSLPCTVEAINVRERRERGESLEEAARRLRYEFLERLATRLGARRVAVGHTADDQAETVFMHLVRGSGTTGLRAMAPSRPLGSVTLIRPLLTAWREEVITYLREQGISWREDASNRDLRFLRNRIRHRILPWLEGEIPGLRKALVRVAEILREEDAVLEFLARESYGELSTTEKERVLLDVRGFRNLHPAIQRRVLRLAISTVKGGLRGIKFSHLERARAIATEEEPEKEVHLPGVSIKRTPETLEISHPHASLPPIHEIYSLPVPGRVFAEAFGVELVAVVEERDGKEVRDLIQPGDHEVNEAVMDADKVPELLLVRGWRHGDRFVPLGMRGHKKLSDFFVDAKIPREERFCIPLVTTSSGDVLWVVGKRIADPVKVTDRTKRILRLRAYRRASARTGRSL